MPAATIPAVVVRFYRDLKDAPLHALDVVLWMGEQKQATQGVHTLGWTEGQVKAYLREVISSFSEQQSVSVTEIAATVELDPALCLLVPCLLKPD